MLACLLVCLFVCLFVGEICCFLRKMLHCNVYLLGKYCWLLDSEVCALVGLLVRLVVSQVLFAKLVYKVCLLASLGCKVCLFGFLASAKLDGEFVSLVLVGLVVC